MGADRCHGARRKDLMRGILQGDSGWLQVLWSSVGRARLRVLGVRLFGRGGYDKVNIMRVN